MWHFYRKSSDYFIRGLKKFSLKILFDIFHQTSSVRIMYAQFYFIFLNWNCKILFDQKTSTDIFFIDILVWYFSPQVYMDTFHQKSCVTVFYQMSNKTFVFTRSLLSNFAMYVYCNVFFFFLLKIKCNRFHRKCRVKVFTGSLFFFPLGNLPYHFYTRSLR